MATRSVQESSLTSLADAIRAKGGTSDTLTFPGGFVSAVEAIDAGGGGDDGSFKAVIERTAVNPTIPSDLTSIGKYAFYNCNKLALTSLPAGVTSIGHSAFQNCKGIKKVTFEGIPTGTISSSAFNGCTNLTVINVPWAEGAVPNAPWGATNATINYNYTGEA